jgi:hypothetical protein
MSIADAIAEFHAVFRLPMRQLPTTDIDPALARLRIALPEEETNEFIIAAEKAILSALRMHLPISYTSRMALL